MVAYFHKAHPPPPQLPTPTPTTPLIAEITEEEDGNQDKIGSWLDQHVDRILISRYLINGLKSLPRRE